MCFLDAFDVIRDHLTELALIAAASETDRPHLLPAKQAHLPSYVGLRRRGIPTSSLPRVRRRHP